MKYLRLNEYKALLYRVLLVYLMYSFSRFLFFIYNYSLLEIDSLFEYFRLSYHGLAFDTTSIFYLNSLFVVLSILPFWVNTNKTYQRFLFTIYFLTNLVGIAFNFVDLIYYKFNYNRTTISEWAVIENENNLFAMFFRFMVGYWDVFLLFFLMSAFWILLYKKVKVHDRPYSKGVFSYVSTSIVTFLLTATIMVGGIRGDFKKSTRPINLVDANRYVNKIQHADFVLNTPFTILRTFNKKTFKRVPYVVPDLVIDSLVQPIKRYKNKLKVKPNIVLFITESYGREYIGAFNQNTNIPDYKSYTPFLDSLATKSLVFDNAFANGRKSIHGMSSILAGIPSFKDAFTSSPYANQEIESVVSVLNSEGFESGWGIWNDGGVDSRRSANDANYASTGIYCVRLRDDNSTSTMTTDDLNLTSYEEITINFGYYARSMDNSNEDFWLQISNNGGASFTIIEEWNLNDEFVNNQFYTDQVIIPGPFNSNTQFRFRADGSGNSDWIYIDDVVISGCSNGGAARIVANKKEVLATIEPDFGADAVSTSLYPNPFNSEMTLKIEGNYEKNIWNIRIIVCVQPRSG